MDEILREKLGIVQEKIGWYLSRIARYPLLPPEHIYLAITNRCNLRCKMCEVARNPSSEEDELSTEEIKDLIKQIKNIGVKHFILSGGEPFLRKDILDIVKYAVESNIEMVDIISNGTLLDEVTIKKLIKINLNHITFSLDGTKEINDDIRGKGVFDKVSENIDLLNFYKHKYGVIKPTVGINFTVMNNNIDSMLPLVEYAEAKHCNIILFQPLLFSNVDMYEKRHNELWPSQRNIKRLRKTIENLLDIQSRRNHRVYIATDSAILNAMPDYFGGRKFGRRFKCYEAIKRIVITSEGKVWSCQGIYGDLREDELRNIWFSKAALEVRKRVAKCRSHCLQDCVYFPSNIFKDIGDLLEYACFQKDSFDNIRSSLLDYINNINKKNNGNTNLALRWEAAKLRGNILRCCVKSKLNH